MKFGGVVAAACIALCGQGVGAVSGNPAGKAAKVAPPEGNATRVVIDLYYETLCPYCRRFIANSLVPLWNHSDFRAIVNIKLVPFGNAMILPLQNVSEGYRFWHQDMIDKNMSNIFECQHYERECFGNRMHVCAIDLFRGPEYFPLISCMEAAVHDSLEKSSYECAAKLGINLNKLDELRVCTHGRKGNELMAKMGRATQLLQKPAGPKEWVPWVVLNGVHSDMAEKDGKANNTGFLMSEVCKLLSHDVRPALCATHKPVASGAGRSGCMWTLAVMSLASILQLLC